MNTLPFEILWEIVQFEWVVFDITDGIPQKVVTVNLLRGTKDATSGQSVNIGQAYELELPQDKWIHDTESLSQWIVSVKLGLHYQSMMASSFKNFSEVDWKNLYK
jgi:hypothetical protein